mgnify:CR=1 FL=1
MKNTTLCYIIRDGQWLMLHRIKKQNDLNEGKWIGVGGKIEENESPEECLLREVREETGYVVRPVRKFLTISEYYEGVRYLSHYFLCEVVGEGATELTEEERATGLEAAWENADALTERFSHYADFAASDEEKRGIYLREWTAMQALSDGE